MNNNKEVELRVCKDCDAPLPVFPAELSYFKLNNIICDDCFLYSLNHEA